MALRVNGVVILPDHNPNEHDAEMAVDQAVDHLYIVARRCAGWPINGEGLTLLQCLVQLGDAVATVDVAQSTYRLLRQQMGKGELMATIEEIRAEHHRIMTQPGGAETPLVARCWRCREVWPCHVVTVLAALDEARAELGTLRAWAAGQTPPDEVARLRQELAEAQAQIARDAPVLAAAEALDTAWWDERRYDADPRGYGSRDHQSAQQAVNEAIDALLAVLDARRAATTPTP